MVQRSMAIVFAVLISGCATKTEIITVTEEVEVPVIRYMIPDVPKVFGEPFVPSVLEFYSDESGGICLAPEDAQKLRYDLERASGRIRSQVEWVRELNKGI